MLWAWKGILVEVFFGLALSHNQDKSIERRWIVLASLCLPKSSSLLRQAEKRRKAGSDPTRLSDTFDAKATTAGPQDFFGNTTFVAVFAEDTHCLYRLPVSFVESLDQNMAGEAKSIGSRRQPVQQPWFFSPAKALGDTTSIVPQFGV